MPVESVKEVLRCRHNPDTEAADFIEGVINLRSRIIPVINAGVKLGLSKKAAQPGNRIIIAPFGEHELGFLVDGAAEVISVKKECIERPDEVLKDALYLRGMAKSEKGLVLIMDIEKLLSGQDRDGLSAVRAKLQEA